MKRFITMLVALVATICLAPGAWADNLEGVYFKAGSGEFLAGYAANDAVRTSETPHAFNITASSSVEKAYKLTHVETSRYLNSGTSGYLSTTTSSSNARYFFFYEATVTSTQVTGTLVSQPVLGKKYIVVVKNEKGGDTSGYYAIYAQTANGNPNRLDVVAKLDTDLPESVTLTTSSTSSNGAITLQKAVWKLTNDEIEAGPYPVGKQFTIRSVGHANSASYYLSNPGTDATKLTRSTTYPADDKLWTVAASTDNGDGSYTVSFENGGLYFSFLTTTSESKHAITICKTDVDDEDNWVNLKDYFNYYPGKASDTRFLYMAVKDDGTDFGWGAGSGSTIRSAGHSYQFCIEPAKTFEDYKAETLAAMNEKTHGIVGYPTNEAHATALAAINAATTKAELSDALTAFNSAAITMPEEGKLYVFRNVKPSDTETYILGEKADHLGVAAIPTAGPVKEGKYPATAIFRAHKLADGQYEFVSYTGKYLMYRDLAADNSNTAVTTTNLQSTYSTIPGSFMLYYGRRSASDSKTGTTIIRQSDGAFDNWTSGSTGSSRTDYSNMFRVVEVEEASFQPDLDKVYYIKHKHSGRYVVMNTSGNATISDTEKTKVTLVPAGLGFAIKDGAGKYLGASSWNTTYSSDIFAWVIEQEADGLLLNQQVASYKGYFGPNNNYSTENNDKIYNNQPSSSRATNLFELEECIETVDYTLVIPADVTVTIDGTPYVNNDTYSCVTVDASLINATVPTAGYTVLYTIDEENKTITFRVEGVAITALSQVVRGQVYTITAGGTRGSFILDGAQLNSTAKKGVAYNEADANQQFAFIEHDSKYYFFSVGGEKFVKITGQNANNARTALTDYPENNTLEFLASTHSCKTTNPVVLNIDGHHVGVSGGFTPAVITHYNSTGDEGNSLAIRPVYGVTLSTSVLEAAEAACANCLSNVQALASYFNNAGAVFALTETAKASLQSEYETLCGQTFVSESEYNTFKAKLDAAEKVALTTGYYRLVNNTYRTRTNTASVAGTYDACSAQENVQNDLGAIALVTVENEGKITISYQGKFVHLNGEGGTSTLTTAEEEITHFAVVDEGGYCSIGIEGDGYGWLHSGSGRGYGLCAWTDAKGANASGWMLVPAESIDITLTDLSAHRTAKAGEGDYWTTLYVPFNFTTDEATIYGTEEEGNYLHVTKLTEAAKGEGYVLNAEQGTATLSIVQPAAETATTASVLTGTYMAAARTESVTTYVFSCVEGELGFYKFEGDNLAANKAYFVPAVSQEVQGFILDFGGITTGISNVNADVNANLSFDLQGRRVNKATRGLFIHNGVKVIK